MKRGILKKAQSKIITSVLVVAIVLILFIIVYNISIPLIKERTEDIGESRRELKLSALEVVSWEGLPPDTVNAIVQAGSDESANRILFTIQTDNIGQCYVYKNVNIQTFETQNVSFSVSGGCPGLTTNHITDISAIVVEELDEGESEEENESSDSTQSSQPIGWCEGTDINRDGTVDAGDYVIWADAEDQGCIPASDNNLCNYTDINRDGVVNDTDWLIWKEHFGENNCQEFKRYICTQPNWCFGTDLNRDTKVDTADYTVWADAYYTGCIPNENNSWCDYADIDRNGVVNDTDWLIWKEHFGKENCDKNTCYFVPEEYKNLICFEQLNNTEQVRICRRIEVFIYSNESYQYLPNIYKDGTQDIFCEEFIIPDEPPFWDPEAFFIECRI